MAIDTNRYIADIAINWHKQVKSMDPTAICVSVLWEEMDLQWFADKYHAKEIYAEISPMREVSVRPKMYHNPPVIFGGHGGGMPARKLANVESLLVRHKLDEKCFKFEVEDMGSVYVAQFPYVSFSSGRFLATKCYLLATRSEHCIDRFIDLYVKDDRARKSFVLDQWGNPLRNFRPMSWDSIFLPASMKKDIRTITDNFFKSESLYRERNVDWKYGFLFAGPPGNGKTAVCRAIATSATHPVIYCALARECAMNLVISLEETLSQYAPCIMIIEDADAMSVDQQARASFLSLLDGLAGRDGVITIASTNVPEKLDEAFTGRPGRFDSYCIFDKPQLKAREQIMRQRLGKLSRGISIKKWAKQMDGFSGAAVQEVAMKAVRDAFFFKTQVTDSLVEHAISNVQQHLQGSSRIYDPAPHIGMEM